jgi:hypothetical protein
MDLLSLSEESQCPGSTERIQDDVYTQQEPHFTYQSLQTGFFSGQLNASLNSREFAMVSCDRYISSWILQQYSDKSKLTMIRADLGACGSL